jgi:serine phosphatase RsbU (regulator of sigma subunit)
VLVVDDQPDIGRLVGVRLKARGFQVENASGGGEALERIDDVPPDIVFLDVAMPGTGGLEVLRSIRQQGLDIAVIMMTAFGTEQVAIEALRSGADDYLRKPFEAAELQAILDRTVTRLRLERQNAALRRQLDAELARAARVQADLLPQEPPCAPRFDIAARCVPAREVGGDFYDWQELQPGQIAITLGDVMGKGMPAALLMATVRAALRTIAGHLPPAEVVSQAEHALGQDLSRSDSFVTLFQAHLDAPSGDLRFVDAGHGLAFIRRAGGSVDELGPRGLPFGVIGGIEYEEGRASLSDGDALVVFTDGLVDACPDEPMDAASIAGRLDGSASAREMVDRLIDLAAAQPQQPDDLTVLVVRCADGVLAGPSSEHGDRM